MPKKKTSPITPSTDSQRETSVLPEEMHSQFNAVAEQYGSINHKLDLQEVALSKVEMEVQIVKSRVGSLDAKVNSVERELSAVKEAVLENSKGLDQLKGSHGDHTTRLDRIEKKIDDIVEDHTARLKALETKML